MRAPNAGVCCRASSSSGDVHKRIKEIMKSGSEIKLFITLSAPPRISIDRSLHSHWAHLSL